MRGASRESETGFDARPAAVVTTMGRPVPTPGGAVQTTVALLHIATGHATPSTVTAPAVVPKRAPARVRATPPTVGATAGVTRESSGPLQTASTWLQQSPNDAQATSQKHPWAVRQLAGFAAQAGGALPDATNCPHVWVVHVPTWAADVAATRSRTVKGRRGMVRGVSQTGAPFPTSPRGEALRHLGWLLGLGAAVAFFALRHPGLPGGDAGELAAAACAGGLAHPPGYPLHGLLARLAALGPAEGVFVRLNLTSAISLAVAVGLLADAVRRWTSSGLAGVAAGGLLLAAPTTWQYATSLEVFALHLALVAFAGWAFVRAEQAPSPGAWLRFGVSCGLALTHHQTALFVVAPLLVVARRAWRGWTPGVLAGAAPLLLLPLFSQTDTPFSWGDARTLDGFLTHVLRREYGTFRLASRDEAGDGAAAFVGAFLRFEWEQAALAPVVGGAAAAVAAWRRPGGLALAIVAALVGSLGLFGALANLPLDEPLFREVVRRFFLMPHLVLSAVAAAQVGPWLSRRPRLGVALCGALATAGAVRAPRAVPGTLEAYGRALLTQPPGALVLVQGDLVSGVSRALQACAGVASGVRVIDQQHLTYAWYVTRLRRVMPDVTFPGERWHPRAPGAFTLEALLDANATRPVVVCGGLKAGDPVAGRLVPEGLCERRWPPGESLDDEAVWRGLRAPAPLPGDFPSGSWEALAQRDVFDARARPGLFALEQAIARGDEVRWLERAATALREAVEDDPSPAAATWKNLGIAEGRLGRWDAMRAAFERYLAMAPDNDPELPRLRALVDRPRP